MTRLIAFGYYGGKFSHLDWLLPLLPVEGVRHYCEPFGGSGAVLFNRPRCRLETYNDLNGELVNFFKVLRDHPQALARAIQLTPYSRREYVEAFKPSTKALERARRFFIRITQGFSNKGMYDRVGDA